MAKWRYYEGTTSANTILEDLSKVLCMAVKDDLGRVIQERNWDIVFPAVNTNPKENDYIAPGDKRNLTNEEYTYKIKNQLRQIEDKIILKTKTTPVKVEGAAIDDLEIESDLNKKSIEMFIEIYKPEYIIDPEKYEPETSRYGVLPLLKTYDLEKLDPDNGEATPYIEKLVRNNHCIFIRAFDELELTYDVINRSKVLDARPKEEVKDDYTGNVLETKSHISEWGKLAWYQDFEEVEIDLHDDDIGSDNISKGIEFIPSTTPGINGDTRLRFWINTNNDRVSLTLMGNPSLEYSSDKFLTSFCYLGRIKSFNNSINDTAGNFALTTSSSTRPAKTVQKVLNTKITDPLTEESLIKFNADGRTPSIGIGDGNKNRFFIPFKYSYNPKTLDVYLNDILVNRTFYRIDSDLLEFTKVIPAPGEIISVRASFCIPEIDLRPGVTRDEFGNVISVTNPNKYGQNTATCVTDVAMYHTRSKAYWQKHMLMFNTTEEYMTKEMYGKSAYTGEYYADRAKITHGNDGPRGMLDSCLVIDQSSLIPLDDLVINRDFDVDKTAAEETYIYFPITSPYSAFSTGPNALSGIAILKDIKLPVPKDNKEAIDRVIEDMYIGKISAIIGDFPLPETGKHDAKITWESNIKTTIDVTTTLGTAKVTRPAEDEPNKEVILTATVTIGSESKEVSFVCTVFPQGLTDIQAVAKDKEWLDLSALNGGADLNRYADSILIVPMEGPNETTVEWNIDDIATISNPVNL